MIKSSNHKPHIIFLMGPTASGKTALAIELVKNFPCDIISVDSAMIYKGMDIGTAKPTVAELKIAPHRLIDICDPAQSYSVGQFCADAKEQINEIIGNGRIPLLVGGTMMYFNALKNGLADLPSADAAIREKLQSKADKLGGWEKMHGLLAKVDPESASRLHFNDIQRIQRALEVYELTGKPMSKLWDKFIEPLEQQIISYAIMPDDPKFSVNKKQKFADSQLQNIHEFIMEYGKKLGKFTRADLHDRIEARFDKMMDMGFLDEMYALYERGDLNADMPSMRCVGYRQGWEYLQNLISLDEFRAKVCAATRQLAKRQITWLRGWEDLVVISG